ncbi:hypothetical protein P775_22510 [Puniceibacterium antarcticum]|uniref:Uncharacterized protein n=1 Tax=Puniceibacterium antarcticum TaxID=1206336 RepID=A0A2G8R8T8_9RHOB|nr:hypothetical protein [Puniceibacterium antarcticum]PIL17932.1 hypothetical protein P775_22510 [Puniceibacterium antarcticum]
MSHQLLARYDSFDKTAFDGDAENRSTAGVSLLQLWHATTGSHWALFNISDADKARAWLDKTAALGHGPTEHHFVETV